MKNTVKIVDPYYNYVKLSNFYRFDTTDIQEMNREIRGEVAKLETIEKELCAATDIDEVRNLMVDSANLMIKINSMNAVFLAECEMQGRLNG